MRLFHYFSSRTSQGEKGEGAGGAPSLVKGRAVGYVARPDAKDNLTIIKLYGLIMTKNNDSDQLNALIGAVLRIDMISRGRIAGIEIVGDCA